MINSPCLFRQIGIFKIKCLLTHKKKLIINNKKRRKVVMAKGNSRCLECDHKSENKRKHLACKECLKKNQQCFPMDLTSNGEFAGVAELHGDYYSRNGGKRIGARMGQ